ncbi:ABC transporter substrate-binding protein [Rhodovastum atsumiense]|uniref:ABC transporter substrate-binding protein n=1 Tax=Rhodovastum atsumiense TaxID=504468 RepID=A0A5M6J197_9PROT|nr:ABC transporter substrate-binding protein [Rhodovastum atsumiense]KAA5614291.1 ABC transporter substrate-binding protein [Rhodovastum atsumiense]CAH2604748.1 ABC transporter substrate-binding protein [Rhodovastum atsumiense]
MLRSLLLASLLATSTLGAAVAADLPATIRERGTIVAAIVPNYPPLDLRDPATGQLSGFDVELGNALAARLGVRMVWQETSFEQMLSAVRTGRVDIVLSGMSDLPARQDNATFIDYLRSGSQFFTQASRAAEFATPTALCGKSVGASRRTALPGDVTAFSDANCVAKGLPPIRVVGTEGSADARTQLRQQRIDAAMQGGETLPYIMTQEPNTYALVGEPVRYTLMGIAVAREATGLQEALADGVRALMADGTYAKLLAKWSLTPSAIPDVSINGGK